MKCLNHNWIENSVSPTMESDSLSNQIRYFIFMFYFFIILRFFSSHVTLCFTTSYYINRYIPWHLPLNVISLRKHTVCYWPLDHSVPGMEWVLNKFLLNKYMNWIYEWMSLIKVFTLDYMNYNLPPMIVTKIKCKMFIMEFTTSKWLVIVRFYD